MKYKVLEDLDFRPILNVHWKVGDFISDYDIDKLFSVSTKEFFILDEKIEQMEVSRVTLEKIYKINKDEDVKFFIDWNEVVFMPRQVQFGRVYKIPITEEMRDMIIYTYELVLYEEAKRKARTNANT